MKARILLGAAGLALLGGACTPSETYFWDAVNGKPKGTTGRELCAEDPFGNKGLCPWPAASDAYATDTCPEGANYWDGDTYVVACDEYDLAPGTGGEGP